MKKLSMFLGLVFVALMVSVSAKAVPAYPKPVTFTQPNGETVTITMKGDEHIHWAVTEDGYTLLPNAEGYMTYAYCLPTGDMVPTNIIASDVKKRTNSEVAYLQTVKKGLTFSKAQFAQARAHRNMVPTQNPGQEGMKKSYVGTQKVVVLLVSFTDVTFSHTSQEFDDLYNKIGYSTGGATGSVRDFYRESSYGQMDLQADVFGPIPLSHNRAYYGANTSSSGGSDQRPAEMVREAVLIADTMFNVDYSRYDVDNDGWVDVINVVFAGHGEESGATTNAIWSHQWNITTTQLDGKKLSKYSCSPECRGSSGSNISRIGVVCHELGHVFGAADYYDIDYSGYDGTGTWDIMASGSWNNSGITPAHHNPYIKIFDYGWVTPKELDFPSSITMQPCETDKDSYYIVRTATNNEFFILENKQKIGYDAYIPGHGLVIYRKAATFSDYGPNDSHPQGFYPICANSSYSIPTSSVNSYGNIGSSGLPFPGTSNKTQFTDATTPTMKSWNGTPTNKPITNITENSDNTITFDFMGGQAFNPFDFTATYNAPSQIDLTWRPFSYKGVDYDVMLVYNTVNQFGTPANTTYNVGQTIYGGGTVLYVGSAQSFAHTNIQQSQHYYYKLYSIIPRGPIFEYSSGVTADVATGCATVVNTFPITLDFEDEIANQCWTVTAGTRTSWARGTASDNSRGLQPKGSYFGFCKLTTTAGDNTYLTSPQLDFSSCTNPKIYFDYSNEKWSNDQDILTVEYRQGTSTTWTTLQTYNTNAAGWNSDSLALPANCTQVRFHGNPRYGYGLFLDDIRIGANYQGGGDATDCQPAHDLAWEITDQNQMKLHWKGEASSYVVTITDKATNQPTSYTVNDTLFIVPNISTRAVYTWTVLAVCTDGMGEAMPGGDFTMLPIDVEIVTAEEMVSVYPNPAREMLRVTSKGLDSKTTCEVFDVNGTQLINFELLPGETLSFDVTAWPQGTYFLRSHSSKHTATQRVIKL